MHGRLKIKTSHEQEEERKIREREKAYHFKDLTDKLFEIRPLIKASENLSEYFKLTNELLLMNPDFYTVWNIRKEALLECRERDPEQADKILKDELIFTLDCLKKNEKSYSVWQHRIWILSLLPKSEYDNEILLCNTFLMKDERNFHCWDYRSYISDIANIDLKSEFDFTTEKIKSNFSNFSAWHRRHKLLLKGLALLKGDRSCPDECNLKLIWQDEYDLILNALFTDPSDQSPWLYHNWLLKNNFGHFHKDQLSNLEELAEMEPDNRWVKQALEMAKTCVNEAN